MAVGVVAGDEVSMVGVDVGVKVISISMLIAARAADSDKNTSTTFNTTQYYTAIPCHTKPHNTIQYNTIQRKSIEQPTPTADMPMTIDNQAKEIEGAAQETAAVAQQQQRDNSSSVEPQQSTLSEDLSHQDRSTQQQPFEAQSVTEDKGEISGINNDKKANEISQDMRELSLDLLSTEHNPASSARENQNATEVEPESKPVLEGSEINVEMEVGSLEKENDLKGQSSEDDVEQSDNQEISVENDSADIKHEGQTGNNEQQSSKGGSQSLTEEADLNENHKGEQEDQEVKGDEDDKDDKDEDDDEDDDDFGAFSDASFDDFENATVPPRQPPSQPTTDPNETPANDYVKLTNDIFDDNRQLDTTMDDLVASIYRDTEPQVSNDIPEIGDIKPENLLSVRSETLLKELITIPKLAPPDWKRSSIRRHFLISIGVPIDLDEVLPSNNNASTDSLRAPANGVTDIRTPTIVFVPSNSKSGKIKPEEEGIGGKNNKNSRNDHDTTKQLEVQMKKNSQKDQQQETEAKQNEKDKIGANENAETEQQSKEANEQTNYKTEQTSGKASIERQQQGEDNTLTDAQETIPAKLPTSLPLSIDSDTIYIDTVETLAIQKLEYDEIISSTNKTLTTIEESLQSTTFYETLYNDNKHQELEQIHAQLLAFDKQMQKTLSVWNNELENLNKDHETFEAVVENVVGYTQKVRRQESFKNEKEVQRKLKRQSLAVKKTGFFWHK